jgi:hypothetical protein
VICEFYVATTEDLGTQLIVRGVAEGKICRDTVFTELCTRIVVKEGKTSKLELVGSPKAVQINVLKLIAYEAEVEELYDQTGALILSGAGLEVIKAGDTLCVG